MLNKTRRDLTKIFFLATTLALVFLLIPLALSADDTTITPITKGPQIVNLGDGISISFDFNKDGNYDLETATYSKLDDPIGMYEFTIKQEEEDVMSVTTMVYRSTSAPPLSIDAAGSEHNSAGYKETQEKSIDGWPGTLSYTWSEETTDRIPDNAKLVVFQFFPGGERVSDGIEGQISVEGRIQAWNKPNGINGYRSIFEEVLDTIHVSGL